jgi:multiple sugar transport system ATP-binding protein
MPANLFVAGFIGSPAMNFFGGHLLRGEDGGTLVEMGAGKDGAARVQVTGTAAEKVARQATAAGREVIIGIRPEHLHLAGEDSSNTIAGYVEVVQHLGNEHLVYLKIPSDRNLTSSEEERSVVRLPTAARAQTGQLL